MKDGLPTDSDGKKLESRPKLKGKAPVHEEAPYILPVLTAVSVAAHLATQLPEEETPEAALEIKKEPEAEDKKEEKDTEPNPDLLTDEPSERLHSPVGEIVRRQVYGNGASTQEHVDRLVDFYLSVFQTRDEQLYFLDALGHELSTAEFPPNWFSDIPSGKTKTIEVYEGKGKKRKKVKKVVPIMIPRMTDEEKNTWQNELRKKIPNVELSLAKDFKSPGYPLIASAVLPGMEEADLKEKSLMDIVLERLKEETHCPGLGAPEGPRHLEGQTLPLYEAILKMADAYHIPHAIALGIAANESGYDKLAISKANAYGIFQLQMGAYDMAKKYAKKHPEFSQKVRKGNLKGFKEEFHGVIEWQNRLVQTEMFCAYFRHLQEELTEVVDKLEDRLQSLDPSYLMGTLSLISTITAYNAGAGRIKKVIRRFLKLSDEEIREMIGKPPYGIDVWQAVLANSFDRITALGSKGEVKNTSGVRMHVFTYATKVLAMGSRIIEEENILALIAKHGQDEHSAHNEEKDNKPIPIEPAPIPEAKPRDNRMGDTIAYFATAFAAVLSGIRSAAESREAFEAERLSRRSVLMGLMALTGLGVPAVKAAAHLMDSKEEIKIPEVVPVHPEIQYPVYEEALADGLERLGELYAALKANGSIVLLPEESNRTGNWITAQRVDKLKPLIRKAFGTEWDSYLEIVPGTKTLPELPQSFFTTQGKKQDAYLKEALQTGETVAIKENDPAQPFFCQQVGKDTGTGNDVDSMYVHREMIPVMGTLIALVNNQIDAFNADPKSFGMMEEEFPKIPHVISIKASGAHRDVSDRHEGSTPSFSDHWTDTALDIISQGGSEGAAVFRFQEALVYKGETLVPAGGLVPAQGHPARTREIVITMIQRALFVLEDSLKGRPGHPEIMPRFEPGLAKNWHVALVPSSIANPVQP